MYSFVRLLFSISLCAASALAAAEPTSFGDRMLEIPVPTGHVAVSTRAPTFFSIAQNYMPPANRLVEFYALPDDADALADEGEPALERYFQLMTLRSSDARPISTAQFDQLIDALEKELGGMDLQHQVDALASKANAETSRTQGIDPNLAISDVAVLGLYRHEPWGSFFAVRSSASAGEDPSADEMVSASTYMLVGQKVVFLVAWSSYSETNDLAWAKSAVGAWAQAIRSANAD